MQKQKTVKDLKEIIDKYNITLIKLDVTLSDEQMCELTRLDQFIFFIHCCNTFLNVITTYMVKVSCGIITLK